MDLSKYHGKGLSGLTNLGNTCFLNSCIQVLNHTYELHEFLNSDKYAKHVKQNIPDSIIIQEWNDLRNFMWKMNATISPNKFVLNVQYVASKKNRELFTGWAQNDMPEFLMFLIECMHNSISRGMSMRIRGISQNSTDQIALACYGMLKAVYEKEYSEIMDMFYGIYVSQIISMNGELKSVKPESFFIMDLPIPENKPNITLYDCFDRFTLTEELTGDNAWYNEHTKQKESVKKEILFWNFPKVLVITLKRFSSNGIHKITNNIDCPLNNLDLSKYVMGYNPQQYLYDLYGVCNHIGGVMGGHYTAFVKNSQDQWVEFNDTSVSIIQNPESNIITPMTYCLFYRKKNNSK
jgi:ubiquitin carboxyl-terminal hydrolase 8